MSTGQTDELMHQEENSESSAGKIPASDDAWSTTSQNAAKAIQAIEVSQDVISITGSLESGTPAYFVFYYARSGVQQLMRWEEFSISHTIPALTPSLPYTTRHTVRSEVMRRSVPVCSFIQHVHEFIYGCTLPLVCSSLISVTRFQVSYQTSAKCSGLRAVVRASRRQLSP